MTAIRTIVTAIEVNKETFCIIFSKLHYYACDDEYDQKQFSALIYSFYNKVKF